MSRKNVHTHTSTSVCAYIIPLVPVFFSCSTPTSMTNQHARIATLVLLSLSENYRVACVEGLIFSLLCVACSSSRCCFHADAAACGHPCARVCHGNVRTALPHAPSTGEEKSTLLTVHFFIRRDNKAIPTKHLILTFASSMLPSIIETGYIKLCPYMHPQSKIMLQMSVIWPWLAELP